MKNKNTRQADAMRENERMREWLVEIRATVEELKHDRGVGPAEAGKRLAEVAGELLAVACATRRQAEELRATTCKENGRFLAG